MPASALAALSHPDMHSNRHQSYTDRPPIAFLDETGRSAENSKQLTQAARNLFGAGKGYISLLVGAPGFGGLYLPEVLEPLQHQARLAATAAQQMGQLGESGIMMVLKRSERPAERAEWHEDIGNTFLLNASRVTALFALHGAAMDEKRRIDLPQDTSYFSPLPGMPVAFSRILHTSPYEMFPSYDDEQQRPISSMVVFYASSPNKDPSSYRIGAKPLQQKIEQQTGRKIRLWTPDYT